MKKELFKLREECARCLLCFDPVCTKACKNGLDPARAVRSVRFENEKQAAEYLDGSICEKCEGDCEKACIHYDAPLRIKEIAERLPEKTSDLKKADLSIDFCGVHCENPFFLSSSIVAGNYDMCARAFDAGWGGVVYKTVGFLIPEELSPRFDSVHKEGTPFIGFKNLEQISDHPLEENLETFRKLKRNYPSKILVASIMGRDENEWTELARLVTEAGADIIECNFSCPQMVGEGLGSDIGQNPELVSKYTAAVKKGTDIPVLAKMTPNIGRMEVPAIAAVEAGADGLAAINTIKSITNINEDTMTSYPDVGGRSSVGGYSGKAVKPIALRFIHDMAKCEKLKGIPISGIGGIETWHDALEFILLGSSNIQITTSVMQYGYRIIDDLISGMQRYMWEHHIDRLSDIVGAALENVVPAEELSRNTISYPMFDKNKCIGCGRCYISCMDGGHQAIMFDITKRKPALIGKNCVGCHLCRLVCPTDAIGVGKRVKKR